MSHPELSSANFNTTKKPGGDENTKNSGNNSIEERLKRLSNNEHSSPDICVRDRVLKEVGTTSTAFIGPAFPPIKPIKPKKPKKPKAKSDIEDTLSEFYKELEKIDTPDESNHSLGKQNEQLVIPSKTPARTESGEAPGGRNLPTRSCVETDGYHNKSGNAQSSWSHRYRSEPYPLKRPDEKGSSSISDQNQWHYPHPLKRPEPPEFHRPHSLHQPHHSEFANPQNVPTNVSLTFKSSETTDRYQNVLPLSSFSPPNVCTGPSQGFYTNSQRPFGRDDQVCSRDEYSDNAAGGWCKDRDEGYWFDEDYDRPQRIVPESEQWERAHHYEPPSNTQHSASVLILMRGLPGSGKTTLARDGYRYDPGLLGSAHEWNQSRAEDALHDGRSPVIIDNTNLQAWEMKPYVRMALKRGYKVDFCEPDTSWKFDPFELEKRNKHSVPHEKIAQMRDRFSFPISIDIVMSSEEPPHVMQRHCPEQQMMRKRDYL
ncbi:NEDD4-binding protein 2-like 2 isoform X2 [Cololabis saira]|uniref:NEDD4-binding protein 2-like 2 isoform X2 n=1 Tax=Cololabis saira TaxID=129043 RepID=UPI002AD414E6|nr:NEDD4-binding protein 2-like 2 isoform X2 [Cololabis saira]